MCLAKDHIFHETKQIDMRDHFVHDLISQGNASAKNISKDDNIMDMLEKVLPSTNFFESTDFFEVYVDPLWIAQSYLYSKDTCA